MGFVRTVRYRMRALLRKGGLDREMDDEMQLHIELLAAEYEAEGLTKAKALRKARMSFGGKEKMKETMREARGILWLEDVLRDLRLAWRHLRNAPGFTVVSLLTLGVGIGVCAAMFSVVNTVLVKPLPFENPDELVWVQNKSEGGLSSQTSRVETLLEWRDSNDVFESMGGYFAFFDYASYLLTDADGYGSERLRGVGITKGFLDTLGVKPILGQDFRGDELVWNGPKVAILSYDFWQRRFDGNPKVIGTSMIIDGLATKIVGVMPRSFDFDSVFTPGTEVEMLLPFPLVDQTNRWGNTLAVVGRLKEGVDLDAAHANLEVISKRLNDTVGTVQNRYPHQVNTTMLNDRVRGPFRLPFIILSAAVVCVLAIACVNIANLLIARANGRKKEFAMRTAIGAKQSHLVRQTLVESLLLSFGGLLIGLPLVFVSVRWISDLKSFSIPLLQGVSVDWQSVVFVVLVSIVTGIACGLYPAFQASRQSPNEALGDGAMRGSSSPRAAQLRKFLVVVEIALSCLLLIGSGLLIRSFDRLLTVDPGFDPSNAIIWRIDGGMDFDTNQEMASFYRGLTDLIGAIPGIEAVGISDTLPMGRNREWGVRRAIEGSPDRRGGSAYPRLVDNGYARALGLSLVSGRFFSDLDTETSEPGVVINEVLSKRLWDDEDPVGQLMAVNGNDRKIIGVVRNVRHSGLDEESGAEMYLSINQGMGVSALEMVVRSEMASEYIVTSVRRVMNDYHSNLPTEDYKMLQSILDKSLAPKRLIKDVLSGFSVVALILASIGLYGVISYSVGQRLREIGIRMAIGSSSQGIISLVLREGILLIGIGLVVGLVSAFAFSRFLTGMLFGIGSTDYLVFGVNALIVGGIAILASLVPVCLALRGDPIRSLRIS